MGYVLGKTEIQTYQFEIDNFKKGASAPAADSIGVNPRIQAMKFSNVNQKLGLTFMVPLNWRNNTDIQIMLMCAIPSGNTFDVGAKINFELNQRMTALGGATKADSVGENSNVDTTSITGPFRGLPNDNIIKTDSNTEFHVYMPTIYIPYASLAGGAKVFYGEINLKDIGVGNVPEISVFQMHANFFANKK